jgi:hypothetical protein
VNLVFHFRKPPVGSLSLPVGSDIPRELAFLDRRALGPNIELMPSLRVAPVTADIAYPTCPAHSAEGKQRFPGR